MVITNFQLSSQTLYTSMVVNWYKKDDPPAIILKFEIIAGLNFLARLFESGLLIAQGLSFFSYLYKFEVSIDQKLLELVG